jgi:TolB-like protein
VDVLLAFILSCSVHYDDHLVEALATTLSKSNQFFVGDLSTLDTYDGAHSVVEARKVVEAITTRGGRPAVGFMAVPVAWASRFGRTTDDLFDGCVNIGIATAMLSEYQRGCTVGPAQKPTGKHSSRRSRRRPSPALRYCILRRLEIDLNITGIPEHVLPALAKLDGTPRDPDVDPLPARAPLFPDGTDTSRPRENTDWSSPRLFLSSPAASPTPTPVVPSAPAPTTLPPLDPKASAIRPSSKPNGAPPRANGPP